MISRPQVAGLLVLLLGCGGRSELKIEGFSAGRCGDGVLDEAAGEACDLGEDNEDRPAILLVHRGVERVVMPLDRPESAVDFYDYRSESSHTGFEEAELSVALLYRDTTTERLSLVVHHGIDEDATGITLEHGRVDMDLSGLPPGTGIEVADEPEDEVAIVAEGEGRGRWEFWVNSDGAVFGPIPFPGSWTITMDIELIDGVERWVYLDESASAIPLLPGREARLVAHETPSACRLDCSIPRCGDGIVDGGEICDDGNDVDGDGCSDACSSLR